MFFNAKFNCKEEITRRAYTYRNVSKKQYDELQRSQLGITYYNQNKITREKTKRKKMNLKMV